MRFGVAQFSRSVLGWFADQIDYLRKKLHTEGKPPPLFRVQTDGQVPRTIKEEPRLKADDIMIDGPDSQLELAIHRIVVADAFIMSRSSFSTALALIGNQSTIIVADCYDRHSLPHWSRMPCEVTTTTSTSVSTSTSTTVSGVSLQGEVPRCLITQSGRDGVGHQLEGKLSCIAMAPLLGMQYVHKPFWHVAHVPNGDQKAAFFEEFFGLSSLSPLLNKTSMVERHQPWPGTLQCNKDGWMRQVELGKVQCAKDSLKERKSVTSVDNCWNRMYCHGYMEAGGWYKLVPSIQAAYFSHPKPDPAWSSGLPHNNWGPKVAVHIRQGDGWYKLKLSAFVAIDLFIFVLACGLGLPNFPVLF